MKKAKFYLLQTNYVGKKLLSTFTQKRVLLTKGSEFSIHSRNFRNTINIVLGDDFPQPLFKTYWTINTYGGQHYPIENSTCIHISIGKKQYLSVCRRYMPRSSFGDQHHPLFTITISSVDKKKALNEPFLYCFLF